ncbi:MAG: sel1 repeat family protein, partial [Arcobacteraceae bacterium]
ALFLFEKSCDSGNRQGCFNLAVMYKHGQGIVPNRQKSEALFSLACRGDLKECHFNSLNES